MQRTHGLEFHILEVAFICLLFWTVEQRIEFIVPHSWEHTVFLGFSKGLSFILLLNLLPVPCPYLPLPPLAASLMYLMSVSLIGPFPICTHASHQSWHSVCRVFSLSSHLVTSWGQHLLPSLPAPLPPHSPIVFPSPFTGWCCHDWLISNLPPRLRAGVLL